MAKTLYTRDLGGDGPPLLILHGLLGATQNWGNAGRLLVEKYHVVLADLRNHGRSFHDTDTSYAAMAEDVARLLDELGWERAHVMGHSMGGKVLMRLVMDEPERFDKAIVVDIAPVDYDHRHEELDAMARLLDPPMTSRKDAEARLEAFMPDGFQRMFVLSNFARKEDGTYGWRVNLSVLREALPALRLNPLLPSETSDVPLHFIAGGQSDYCTTDYDNALTYHFPNHTKVTLESSGHNPHIDNREGFVDAVGEYLG